MTAMTVVNGVIAMTISSSFSRRLMFLFLLSATACQSMYFGAMESLGYPKRDLFVKRVAAARDSQKEAKQEFRSALEQFASVVHVEGGELETKYNKLDRILQRCEGRAKDVKDRIQAVKDVSEALFREWKTELRQYKDQSLRRASEKELSQTEDRYEQLMEAMNRAAARMEPVLEPLRDKVLFLKHNLNARAVSSLDGELVNVERNVDELVREMEDAIREADRFIAEMKT